MTFDECTYYLDHLPRLSGFSGLDPMRRALAALVDQMPALREYRPRIIHVAGTNGKGSTCAMLERIFRLAGVRTGLYISPHLVDYTERIRVNGENIPKDRFAALLSEVVDNCKKGRSSAELCPFDFLTLTSLLYFAETQTELIVLETGLGGKYDATTAVCEAFKPIVTAITSVSPDHMEVLGKSLKSIAQQKAGILVPQVPVVLAKNPLSVRRTVKCEARRIGAPFHYAGALSDGDEALYQTLSLQGGFQKDNLSLVLSILKVIGEPIARSAVEEALRTVSWPARQQPVETDGARFIIDGAHNRDAFKRLLEDASRAGRSILLFGMLGRKDVDGVIKVLAKAKCFDKILYTSFGAKEHCAEFDEFRTKMHRFGFRFPIEDAGSLDGALAIAKQYSMQKHVTVWCAGSLYLAGEILKALGKDGTHC